MHYSLLFPPCPGIVENASHHCNHVRKISPNFLRGSGLPRHHIPHQARTPQQHSAWYSSTEYTCREIYIFFLREKHLHIWYSFPSYYVPAPRYMNFEIFPKHVSRNIKQGKAAQIYQTIQYKVKKREIFTFGGVLDLIGLSQFSVLQQIYILSFTFETTVLLILQCSIISTLPQSTRFLSSPKN